jgi:diguanylate cyclase (GGDEF)-like protein
MSAFALLKKHWPWTALALPFALIAAAAVLAPGKVGQMELEREAKIAAERIGAELAGEPGALIDAFTRPALAPHIGAILDASGYGRRVLRYELYDASGRLSFTSGRAGLALDRGDADQTTVASVQEPEVTLHQRSGSSVSDFAVLTLPLKLNGRPDGALLVYLDQSDQASVLFRYFGLIAVITLVLLGAGIATPAALAWLRSREREEAEAQVRYLENYDLLTGLPNRKSFNDRLTVALAIMKQNRSHIAVLCLDVDRFQEINDSVDLAGGDAVLREIGGRIQSTLRKGDILARRASDEFAIALVGINNLGDVMAFMTRLVEVLKHPFYVSDREFVCTTSVGVALAPTDGDTAAEILRHADIALARAKSDGGQRMRFFEASMDKALQRRRTVEHELRLALSREEFEVVYQSQYDLATGAQVGVEALVRWHHPVHGKIAPAHFISVAEETGLIVPLGERVLRRACRDAALWPEPLSVAVNLSPAQFHDSDIADTVASILQETGLPAERLELEITESLLINDTEEVLEKLSRLRELGVKIAMDDFGTGYSSLNYLARFPFDKIKIDRQFVRNMTRDPAMRAIVRTIVALGKSLGVTVTAEGVESQEQAAMLREFGCPQVQGFLYGYPGAADTESKGTAKVTPIKPQISAA